MGLSIHYTIRSRRQGKNNQRELLEGLRGFALEMKAEGLLDDVSPVEWHTKAELEQVETTVETTHTNPLTWWHIQAKAHVTLKTMHYMIPALEGYSFQIEPGNNCEPANFGLVRHPTHIPNTSPAIPIGKPGWNWSSSCKTTYADQPVKCHLAVVSLLDWLNQQTGIDVTVNDDSDYWTRRDVTALAHKFQDDSQELAALAEYLRGNAGPSMSISSPISERPDAAELAEKGRQRLDPMNDSIERLHRLIQNVENNKNPETPSPLSPDQDSQ